MISILGIQIERKTDILALAAFLLSLSSLLTQAAFLLRGADTSLEPPQQILLLFDKYADGKSYLRMTSSMVYVNTGSPDYSDIVRHEFAHIIVGSREIRLNAQNYVTTSISDGTLNFGGIEDAAPFKIESGSVVSHEVYFAPWPNRDSLAPSNYLEAEEFLRLLKKQETISVRVGAILYSGERFTFECTLTVSEFSGHLERKGWTAPVCSQLSSSP